MENKRKVAVSFTAPPELVQSLDLMLEAINKDAVVSMSRSDLITYVLAQFLHEIAKQHSEENNKKEEE